MGILYQIIMHDSGIISAPTNLKRNTISLFGGRPKFCVNLQSKV